MAHSVEEFEATHEEVCDHALEHYEEISKEASHYSSLVPKAIEFFNRAHAIDQETRAGIHWQ